MKRRVISTVLILLVTSLALFCIPYSVTAEDETAHSHAEMESARYQSCTACGSACLLVCAAAPVFYYQTTHGIINKCTVNVYKSKSAVVCPYCGNVNEVYDYHMCWKSHQNCGAGFERICICDVKPPHF